MKKLIFGIFIIFSICSCCPSDETIKLSEGVAAYTVQQDTLIKELLADDVVVERHPELTRKIDENSSALVRATKTLWLLLVGQNEDEVIE